MEEQQLTIVIKNWIAITAGVFGVALGLYNFFKARNSENKEKQREEFDWDLYIGFLEQQRESSAPLVLNPELGSHEHKWAERMVVKGFLVREPMTMGYSLANRGRS